MLVGVSWGKGMSTQNGGTASSPLVAGGVVRGSKRTVWQKNVTAYMSSCHHSYDIIPSLHVT